jgi:hypothetical protein
VYAEAEQGWWCFGCQRVVTSFDLASLMAGAPWARNVRGEAFRAAGELMAAVVE